MAAEIRRAIADGEAGPWGTPTTGQGHRGRPGVNKNTVLRAMHILRDEGLLEFTRGRGITVSGTPEKGAVLRRSGTWWSSPAVRVTAAKRLST